MKRLSALVLVLLFLTGCVFPRDNLKRLNVTWRLVNESVSLLALNSEGGLDVREKYFGYVPGVSSSSIYIEADVNGDTSGEFEFDVASINKHERVSNNKIKIIPQVAEKGSVLVSSQGLEKMVEFEIFPTGAIRGNILYPNIPQGFNFVTGNMEFGVKHDMWMFDSPEVMYAKVGAIIDKKPDTFWDDFIEINNLHSYEYEEMSFEPDYNKVYLIKCEVGYAAVMFHTSGWSFIYKYSETGIFD